MKKHSILPPFAYCISSEADTLPLNSVPRDRKTIDENAQSIYHTRGVSNLRKSASFDSTPGLKRRGGESFNEKDDVKRREKKSYDVETDDEINTSVINSQPDEEMDKENLNKFSIPSSPYIGSNLQYEGDIGEPFGTSEHNEDNEVFIERPFFDLSKMKTKKVHINPSSDTDFGIDSFNRFKSTSQVAISSEDYGAHEVTSSQLQDTAQTKARHYILEAFENMQTTLHLESFGISDIPDEIKDFQDLVIFDSGAKKPQSYQLYLTNNNLESLNISLFEFTKLNVLVLRQNRLRRIPSTIKKLQKLRELSLGANKLKFLPSSILELGQLENLQVGPNPFLEPSVDACLCDFRIDDNRVLKYISPVSYKGNPEKQIQSLKTKCLDKIARYDVSYQETRNWKHSIPKIFHTTISKAIVSGKYMENCSECNTIVVHPYAEAFEWWDVFQNKSVPFQRVFCSGRCVGIWKNRTSASSK